MITKEELIQSRRTLVDLKQKTIEDYDAKINAIDDMLRPLQPKFKDIDMTVRLQNVLVRYFEMDRYDLMQQPINRLEEITATRFLKVRNAGATTLNEVIAIADKFKIIIN